MLPYNTVSGELYDVLDPDAPMMAMSNPYITKLYVAGDIRANENILLTSMHTLFVREHNRICDELYDEHPTWSDEDLYQRARKLVGAIIQAIVYEEWLPTLGVHLPPYQGYNDEVNPGILNVFSAAAFRFGHTTINSQLRRLDANGSMINQGHISLSHAFFNPPELDHGGGISPLLRGTATQVEQSFDTKMISDLRNFLFGPPGAGGLDLAAINIYRGRERGLADYNSIRAHFGLPKRATFQEISSDPYLNNLFRNVYGDINNIDPWVGFLGEDRMDRALFGETVMRIIEAQFTSIRDGDRFYYWNDASLSEEEKTEISRSRLSQIIMRNTDIDNLQHNVFLARPMTSTSTIETEGPLAMSVYPNPSPDHVFVNLYAEKGQDASFQVIDAKGLVVVNQTRHLDSGMNNFEVTLSDLPTGSYYLVLKAAGQTAVEPIVKI